MKICANIMKQGPASFQVTERGLGRTLIPFLACLIGNVVWLPEDTGEEIR